MAQAAFAVVAVKVGLRIMPVRLIRAASTWTPSSSSADGETVARRLLEDVAGLGRVRVLMTDCLSRSLAVLFLARWYGTRLRLVIGVHRTGASLDAHAWLECDGRPLSSDDVVQRVMLPVGDSGAGGIQSHVKWRGPEHPRHFCTGGRALGMSRSDLARLRRN